MNKFVEEIKNSIITLKNYKLTDGLIFEKINNKIKIKIFNGETEAIFPLDKFQDIDNIKTSKTITHNNNKFKLKKANNKINIKILVNNKEYEFLLESSSKYLGWLFYIMNNKLYISIKGYCKKNEKKKYDIVITPDERFLIPKQGLIPSSLFYYSVPNADLKDIEMILDIINSDKLAKKNTYIGISGKIDLDFKKYKNLNIKQFEKIAKINTEKIVEYKEKYNLSLRDLCSIDLGFGILNSKLFKEYKIAEKIEELQKIEKEIIYSEKNFKKNPESIDDFIKDNNISFNDIKYFEKNNIKFLKEIIFKKEKNKSKFSFGNTNKKDIEKEIIYFLYKELENIKNKKLLKKDIKIFQEFVLYHLQLATEFEMKNIVKFLFVYLKENDVLFLNKLQMVYYIFAIIENDYLEWIINFIYENYDLSIPLFNDEYQNIDNFLLKNIILDKMTLKDYYSGDKNPWELNEKDISEMMWTSVLKEENKKTIIKKYIEIIKGKEKKY